MIDVMRTYISTFDTKINAYVAQWPHWLNGYMHTVSFLGLPIITLSIGVFVVFWGVVQSNMRLSLAGGGAMATIGVNALMKLIFQRERPATGYVEEMLIHSYSFPSGHSAGSMVIYGLLAYLAFHSLPQPWGIVVAILLAILILSVGVSRIYLGAHFASDVLGGWLIGAIGLVLIIHFIRPML